MAVCTLAVIYMCSDRLRLLCIVGENLDVNAVLADLGLRQIGVCFGHSLRHGRYFVRLSALRGAVQLLFQTVLEPVDHRVARNDDAAAKVDAWKAWLAEQVVDAAARDWEDLQQVVGRKHFGLRLQMCKHIHDNFLLINIKMV